MYKEKFRLIAKISTVILVALFFCFVFYLAIYPTDSKANPMVSHDEHIVWDKMPIEITLPVGTERLVTFPDKVQFGYDTSSLSASILRVQNDDHTLYLLAHKGFSTQRVEAKLASGDIILLDLSASKEGDDTPIDIVLPTTSTQSSTKQNTQSSKITINYMTLMRFAIQQLYAPKRLLKQPMNINRFPMDSSHTIPLSYDGSLVAMPLASWRGGELYVTAIQVRNLLGHHLRLDPRLLCGNWQAASFYPSISLAASGTRLAKDMSTFFAISTQPLSMAIKNCAT